MPEFSAWLDAELKRRGLNKNQFAVLSGLDSGHISNVLNEIRKPGPEFCRAVAKSLEIPQYLVFYQAGLLTELPSEFSVDVIETMGMLEQLPERDQQDIMDMVFAKRRRQEGAGQGPSAKEKPR